MASLTDDPSLTRNIQGARRDFGLIHKAYRKAKRAGDYKGALELAQTGDRMGLAIGRPANDRYLEGAGQQRYAEDLEISGAAPRPGGLDGYDNRHSSVSGVGVGGFDFRQSRDRFARPSAPQQSAGVAMRPGDQGPPLPANVSGAQTPLLPEPQLGAQAAPTSRPGANVDDFRARWKAARAAGDQNAADDIIAEGHAAGLQLSAGGLQRFAAQRQRVNAGNGAQTGVAGAVGPAGATAPAPRPDPAPYATSLRRNPNELAAMNVAADSAKAYLTPESEAARATAREEFLRPSREAFAAAQQRTREARAASDALPQPSPGYRERFSDSEGNIDMGKVDAYHGQRMGEMDALGRERQTARRRFDDVQAYQNWKPTMQNPDMPEDARRGQGFVVGQDIGDKGTMGGMIRDNATTAKEWAGRTFGGTGKGIVDWFNKPGANPGLKKRPLFNSRR